MVVQAINWSDWTDKVAALIGPAQEPNALMNYRIREFVGSIRKGLVSTQ